MPPPPIVRAFNAVIYFASGMVFWEYLVSLKFEIDHYTGKRRWTKAFTLYLISRYSGIVNIVLDEIIIYGRNLDCEAIDIMVAVSGGVSIAASTLIFVARACAIWSWRKRISIPLFTLTAFALVACIANAHWIEYARSPTRSACVITHVGIGFSISNGIAISVDIVTLVALIVGIKTQQDAASRKFGLARILLNDGALYVGVLLIFNIGSIMMSLTQREPIGKFLLAAPTCLLR